MNIKRHLRTALGILGLAGIAAFFIFPSEKNYECLEKSLGFYQYGDSASGVASATLEKDGFKCELSKEEGMCGIGFSFTHGKNKNFRNWNLMDSLRLDLQGSANLKEIVVQILTFDPDHTDLENRGTMKPMMKEVILNPNESRYSIYMEHFYTPDYWFEQQNAKNRGNFKRFSAVSGIEIFSGWKNNAGEPLGLKIENICVEGHSNFSFVLLICYLTVLIAIAISVRIR